MKRNQQQGVALVITLLLLTVITVIAVAFLAVTHRERASVTETLSSTDSEFAMSAALERAKAEIIGTILSSTNLFNTELRVSTTFPSFLSPSNSPAGVDFSRNPDPPDLNNINYDYDNGGGDFFAYTTPQWFNLYKTIGQNLFFDPRAPVFVNTNRGGKTGPLDYRYYLDLNRNGRFEKTGILPVIGPNGQVVLGDPNDPNNPGGALTKLFIGDPEWIGILQFPNLFHSHTNRFIARYAYMIMPAGKSLDLNYIGNQARLSLDMKPTPTTAASGYLRNQGFGSWELNLGAFLTDLNTNVWSGLVPGERYDYRPNDAAGNQGNGFSDAVGLLHYRYRRSQEAPSVPGVHRNLPTATMMFPNVPNLQQLFTNDLIDAYVNGPIAGFGFPSVSVDDSDEDPSLTWPGGEGKQHFFRPDDFFDRPSLDFPEFKARMQYASAQTSFYDRYTFYRMLTQLGTDSVPEKDVEQVTNTKGETETIVNKINLNYQNVGLDSFGNPAFNTNLVHWRPLDFFSNTAHILLRQEFAGYGVTNIPVFTNNSSRFGTNRTSYPILSPRVRQLLQIAANIYDATTNSPFPTIFSPIYEKRGNDIYISGFTEVTNTLPLTKPWRDLDDAADRAALQPNDNVYNIGLIVGARKGLPNFNEFKNYNYVQVSRKLEFIKTQPSQRPYTTNQQLSFTVSNSCGVELWNSYTNALTNILVRTDVDNTYFLTNNNGPVKFASTTRSQFITNNNWLGRTFVVPPGTNETVLEPSSYISGLNPPFVPHSISKTNFDTNQRAFTNKWGLDLTNRVRCFMVDQKASPNRILDVVGLRFDTHFDISAELDKPIDPGVNDPGSLVWDRKAGVQNQILKSARSTATDRYWAEFGEGTYNQSSSDEFGAFIGLPRAGATVTATNKLVAQAPYVPVRRMYCTNSWQANDPLVHYTEEDLLDSRALKTNGVITVRSSDTNFSTLNLGRTIHGRYKPWGIVGSNEVSESDYPLSKDPKIKDSMVTQPDDWQFPAQKFPNIGWLGRVHRGTPWQTLNFKGFSNEVDHATWAKHVGAAYMAENHPTNDWRLVDLFTVAIHPNATKGQLSINQTNLAGWSAVLSGIGITTLEEDSSKKVTRENRFLEPSANMNPAKGDAVFKIVKAINDQRARMPMKQFLRLSDFISTPELTAFSPLLNEPFITKNSVDSKKTMLTDLDYERIPDEILSLVKVGDVRFVVYAYGQSLKPAPNLPDYPSIVTTGPYAGMCINYQITGETAARAVIRVDFERVLDPTNPDYLKLDYRRPHAVVESFNVLTP
jgi:hypothetical protein